MRDVAIISFAQTNFVDVEEKRDDVEMIRYAANLAKKRAGIDRSEVGFTCSGSCDYVQGVPFSFVAAVDALGAWPPIQESHVEMDGAWALYEAYMRLQHGDIDVAQVFCFGKPSIGIMADVFSQQVDPYSMAPLWPDPDSMAGLQARALVDAGIASERDFAEIAARSKRDALKNEAAHSGEDVTADALLDAPLFRSPLRKSDVGTESDGAAAMIIATGDKARELEQRAGHRVAWIRGIDHRVESGQLGWRDLTTSESTQLAGQGAGVKDGAIQVAELHANYSHEEILLKRALGLGDEVSINPSGGCFGANAPMTAGLVRIGEAASRIFDNSASRALGHATSGPCLQQNLVCVLEGK